MAQSPKNCPFDENTDDYAKRTLAIYGILEAGFHETIFLALQDDEILGVLCFIDIQHESLVSLESIKTQI